MPRGARLAHKYLSRTARPGGGWSYEYAPGARSAGKGPGAFQARGIASARTAHSAAAPVRPVRIARGWRLHARPFEREIRTPAPGGGFHFKGMAKTPEAGFHLQTLRGSNTYFGSSQALDTRRSLTVNLGEGKVYSKARPSRQINAGMRNPFAQDYVSHELRVYRPTPATIGRLKRIFAAGRLDNGWR